MLDFRINEQNCIHCGQCVADCTASIISMEQGGYPFIPVEKEARCIACQHCLAICPTASVSIFGLDPANSRSLVGGFPDPDNLEILMKGRRSVRRYKSENLDPELLERLLEVAWHAPTGVNSRQVCFTVLDSKEKVAQLRDEVIAGLAGLVKQNALPQGMEFFANFVQVWEERQTDVIFRGAPHLLIASAPAKVASPMPDCLIALSYFELFAQANGIGTVWNGLAKWAINDLVPETRHLLGISDDHVIGYVMAFGKPAVHYFRTVQHAPALINRPL